MEPNNVVTSGGQHYEFAGEKTVTRVLFRWRSRCADCGAPFELTTARPLDQVRYPSRRCKAHRKPGVRVNPARASDV